VSGARTTTELGATLRRARRDRGWTQATLAAAAGISRPALINLERGNPHGELGVALRVIAALGLTVDLQPATGAAGAGLDALLEDLGSAAT